MADIEAVLINDTSGDHHHGCMQVMSAIHQLCGANGIRIIASAPAHAEWRLNEAFLAQLDRAALVIVNGEGSIHHNRPAARRLVAAGAIARQKGKRSALINMSWFDNDRQMADALIHFDLVAARESASVEAVRSVRPDCHLVPDLSLYGPRADSRVRKGIGFGDSVLAGQAMELQTARDRHDGRFVPIIFSAPGLVGKLRLMRWFVSRKRLAGGQTARSALREAFDHAVHEIGDPERFLAILSRLQLMVTGRFHGITLALRANTPVLAVPSNTGKNEALLSDAGLSDWRLVAPAKIDEPLLARASSFDEREQTSVRRYLDLASEQAETLFRDIRALA